MTAIRQWLNSKSVYKCDALYKVDRAQNSQSNSPSCFAFGLVLSLSVRSHLEPTHHYRRHHHFHYNQLAEAFKRYPRIEYTFSSAPFDGVLAIKLCVCVTMYKNRNSSPIRFIYGQH